MYARSMSRSDGGSPAPAGGELRERRESAGLSLRAFARRSNYSTSYLSRVETGRRPATPALVLLYIELSAPRADAVEPRTPRTPRRPPATVAPPAFGVTWFGSEVRRRRMAAGRSLDALGTEVFLSRSYLGKIEQGDARGSFQIALSLDAALAAQGSLTSLFLEECARVGPVAPDPGILLRGNADDAPGRSRDPVELASTAAARLARLRIRSHRIGPHAILRDLGDGIVELFNAAGGAPRGGSPIWPVTLQYAELLGWSAQETGHHRIALRWTDAVADWAAALGDAEARSYALIRLSQQARRRGEVAAALELARRAGAVPGLSPRMAQFAAQRETQANALARDEPAFRRSLDRYRALLAEPSARQQPSTPWGPAPDPRFESSRVFEATCLIDLADFRAAARLFDEGMAALGSGRTGYARLAVRQAIASAHVGEIEHACEVALGFLPTVARQGSASLRGDLKRLTRVLNRHHRSPAVRALLPDLTALTRADCGMVPVGPAPVSTPNAARE